MADAIAQQAALWQCLPHSENGKFSEVKSTCLLHEEDALEGDINTKIFFPIGKRCIMKFVGTMKLSVLVLILRSSSYKKKWVLTYPNQKSKIENGTFELDLSYS
jgi:hypothetical protein